MANLKFQFKIQKYQTDAVEAVIRVFDGQPKVSYEKLTYNIDRPEELEHRSLLDFEEKYVGYRNAPIRLSNSELLKNINDLQIENNISISKELSRKNGCCFLDIEMETGTGKTYVYTKTIFELNKQYGWSKFVVVVPSIAIKEGVKKSFEQTVEHFYETYGKKANFFVFDVDKLSDIEQFSSDIGINVIIINYQKFSTKEDLDKKTNKNTKEYNNKLKIYKHQDSLGGRIPMSLISENNPILILDEPQKLEGEATQNALKYFQPLFCINYSATHKTAHNLIFVLDALEAYNRKLVKKIVVKGIEVKNLPGTSAYMYLEDIKISKDKPPIAYLNIEQKQNNGSIKRVTKGFVEGDNLFEVTHLPDYKGFIVDAVEPVNRIIKFSNEVTLSKGTGIFDEYETNMRRIQIREAIRSHFETEKKLYRKGIKTLSLFFIDDVAKYRQYDNEDNQINGEYGSIFEEEYMAVLNEQKDLFDPQYMKYLNGIDVAKTHDGYFSVDRNNKKHFKNTNGESNDDESTYNKIMSDKEKLLSFEEPIRFIFSHSALGVGWDNPNVFQICILRNPGKADKESIIRKRQEVGRGMRICVDKTGKRMDLDELSKQEFHNINRLTVIANEEYSKYAGDLQSAIREVLYKRPLEVAKDFFIGRKVAMNFADDSVNMHILTADESNEIYEYCLNNGYIDKKNHITEKFKKDARDFTLPKFSNRLEPYKKYIIQHLQEEFDEEAFDEMIENGFAERKKNKLNNNFSKDEFKRLWSCIKHKYSYNIHFSSEKLIENSIKSINENLKVNKLMYRRIVGEQKSEMRQDDVNRGISFEEKTSQYMTEDVIVKSNAHYDLIKEIASKTLVTRKTIGMILSGISKQKFDLFAMNPQKFIKEASLLICEEKDKLVTEGISYNKIPGEDFKEDIFAEEIKKNESAQNKDVMITSKGISDYLFSNMLDSNIERNFANELEHNENVCVYAKLPLSYSFPTPYGDYTPDWAVCYRDPNKKEEQVYFVIETKGNTDVENLRLKENAKIKCARKLFESMKKDTNSKITYHETKNFEQFIQNLNSLG